MPTLGQKLREERQRRGWTIDQLANETRINRQYFEAIEKDDIGSLPGGFFYRSFVRQYARLLELPDSDYAAELQRSLDEESSIASMQESALPQRHIDVPPIPTGRIDTILETRRLAVRLGGLVLVLALCSGIYTFWVRWKTQQEDAARFNQPAITEPVKKVEQRPVTPAPPPTAPADTAANAEPPKTEAPPQPAADKPAEPAPAATGAVQLIVRAKELTWVGVWQGEKVLFGNVLRAGETRGFGSPDRLRVRLGNAGGVELEWNGKPVTDIGPKGQVRTVDFRADGYSVVQPAPAAAPVKPDGY
jgi:cytoskeleton protein RodZ